MVHVFLNRLAQNKKSLKRIITFSPSNYNFYRKYQSMTLNTEIIKSMKDKRQYRQIKLANDIKCLLISDNILEKAAVSMQVNVGNWSDPDHLPGLAHFLEHMLFLGTKDYPQDDFFEKFLNKYDGNSNAYTEEEYTTYYYNIRHENLLDSFPRFSSFFKSPLLSNISSELEINSIDSEHEKNVLKDNWRMMFIEKELSDHKHPFHKFTTGNKQTLLNHEKENGETLNKELKNFFYTHYSSNLMTLVVLGKENLDILESAIKDNFSNIPNYNIKKETYTWNPIYPVHCMKEIKVVPVKDIKEIQMKWTFPGLKSVYKSKPHYLLSHLVGHEGKGSILSYLKEKKFAKELSAGFDSEYSTYSSFSTFSINIELTEHGFKNIEEIIIVIFQYIHILKNMSADLWLQIYNEVKQIEEMKFKFIDKENSSSYVTMLSSRMNFYDSSDILVGPFLYKEFNIEDIKKFVDYLDLKYCRYFLVSKDYENKTNLIEPIYNIHYSIKDFDKSFIEKIQSIKENENLSLPEKNRFISSDFRIFSKNNDIEQKEYPRIILKENHLECYFGLDSAFKMPKVYAFINILAEEIYLSPTNSLLTKLYVDYINHFLKEYIYDAYISGINFEIYTYKSRIQIEFEGYNQKMIQFIEMVLDKIKNIEFNEKDYQSIKEYTKREIKSFNASSAYKWADYNLSHCIEQNIWHIDEYIELIDDIDINDLRMHIKKIYKIKYTQIMVYGNMLENDAHRIIEIYKNNFPNESKLFSRMPMERTIKLQKKSEYIHAKINRNKDDKNSCILNYYEVGFENFRKICKLRLIEIIISEMIFNQLRTKEQLGYLVWGYYKNSNKILSFNVKIQSAKHPELIDSRINKGLNGLIYEKLKSLSEEKFILYKKSLLHNIMEKSRKMKQLSIYYWREIVRQTYIFDKKDKLAETLESIKKDSVLNFYKKHILENGTCYKKLSIQIIGNNKFDDHKINTSDKSKINRIEIDDYYEFKKSRRLYQLTEEIKN